MLIAVDKRGMLKTTDNFRLSLCALHWLLLRYMEATLGSRGRIKADQGRVEKKKWYTKGIREQESTDVLFLVFFALLSVGFALFIPVFVDI